MFPRLKRLLCAGLFVLGTTAALTVSGTVTAPALPPGTIILLTGWDVNQRPSGTTDDPLGFHVLVTPDAGGTTFSGTARTLTQRGDITNGVIQGKSISFTIEWRNDGKVGLYQGSWFDDGYLRGHAQEQDSSRTAEWWTRYNDWNIS
ncbi:hypothetical protein [Nocardia jejuensis]|uniref:hypothetical protein n=1 Tax=Nocardia jejuensis TaxID=328049 RepID=UPI00083146C9|nr:hypothetical protein [Nocardia jejuensis]